MKKTKKKEKNISFIYFFITFINGIYFNNFEVLY